MAIVVQTKRGVAIFWSAQPTGDQIFTDSKQNKADENKLLSTTRDFTHEDLCGLLDLIEELKHIFFWWQNLEETLEEAAPGGCGSGLANMRLQHWIRQSATVRRQNGRNTVRFLYNGETGKGTNLVEFYR